MSVPYLVSPNYGWGSGIATPTTGNANGISFIAEEANPDFALLKTTRETELGAPNGWIGVADRRTWRGTWQIATNATAHPDCGDEFIWPRITTSTNGVATSVNVTYAIDSLGEPKRQRDFWKLEVGATEKA